MIERQVVTALNAMKRGKAVGPDYIPVEAWRLMGEKGLEMLLSIFTGIMETERMPEE